MPLIEVITTEPKRKNKTGEIKEVTKNTIFLFLPSEGFSPPSHLIAEEKTTDIKIAKSIKTDDHIYVSETTDETF